MESSASTFTNARMTSFGPDDGSGKPGLQETLAASMRRLEEILFGPSRLPYGGSMPLSRPVPLGRR
jgi:hypothetical protein